MERGHLMSTRLKAVAVLVLALVIHTSVLSNARLADVRPDLMLLVAVCGGLAAGPERGAIFGFACGLAADVYLQTPVGLSALTFSLVAFAVGTIQGTILRSTLWIAPLTAFVASAAGVVLFAVVGAVVGQTHLLSLRVGLVALLVGVTNALLAPIVSPIVSWAIATDTSVARP